MPTTARHINASRANGALSHCPKTEAGKQNSRLNATKTGAFAKSIILNNESPTRLTKLRDEYYQTLQPTNPIERDIVEEMVISKWLSYRAWGLESSSVNYKMDEQKEEVEAKHARLKERTRTAIAHKDMYDNSSPAADSARLPGPLNQLQTLRRNSQMQNAQTNLIPKTDTTSEQENQPRRPSRRQRILRRLLQPQPMSRQRLPKPR